MGLFSKIANVVKKVASPVTKVVGTVAKVAMPIVKTIPVVGTAATIAEGAVNLGKSLFQKSPDAPVEPIPQTEEIAQAQFQNAYDAQASAIGATYPKVQTSLPQYMTAVYNPQTGLMESPNLSAYSANPAELPAMQNNGYTDKVLTNSFGAVGVTPKTLNSVDLGALVGGVYQTAKNAFPSFGEKANAAESNVNKKITSGVEGAAQSGLSSALSKYWWALLAIPAAFVGLTLLVNNNKK